MTRATLLAALRSSVSITALAGQAPACEAAPFVTLPDGPGNGWTIGSGR